MSQIYSNLKLNRDITNNEQTEAYILFAPLELRMQKIKQNIVPVILQEKNQKDVNTA